MKKYLTRYKKIAVAGMARSGKTVFLTSLINHILEHNTEDFRLEPNDAKIVRPRVKAKEERDHFQYHSYREDLVRSEEKLGAWPLKTKDTSQYKIVFERSDWKRKVELHLFDFPGERMADVAIERCKTYDEWSRWILRDFRDIPGYGELAVEYMRRHKDTIPDERQVLISYKQLLLRFIDGYLPLVSPSCFLLDMKGEVLSGDGAEEERIENRYVGLPCDSKGHSREFAPLPEEVIQQNPSFLKSFRRNYKIYRKEVVLPIYERLRKCDACILLISIPFILAGGVGRLNVSRPIIENFTALFEPESQLKKLGRWLPHMVSQGRVGNSATRIAFVASMSDLVSGPDRQDKLKGLLTQLTRRAKEVLEDIEIEHFTMAAVRSTEPIGDESLRGIPWHSENQARERLVFPVSRLPEYWPNDWKTGDYTFQRVHPEVPPNVANPPKHDNLNSVFNFLIG